MTASLLSAPASATARRSILLMIGASGCFAANDAIVKFVSQSLPGPQLIFLRSLIAAGFFLLMIRHQGVMPRLAGALQPRVLARSACDAFGTVMYLLSLFHLPLANATAINLAAPVFMTLFAVLFLGERASPARWVAVALGFAGVLAVVQPTGDGFNAWALLCVGGTLLQALRDLLTRGIDPTLPSMVIALSTTAFLALVAGAMTLTQGWAPVALRHLLLLALAAGFLATAYLFLIASLRTGDISLTAPFRYTALLFAVLLGYALWGQWPNAWAWAGIALLVGSGVYAAHRERARHAPTRAPGSPPA
ncbi:EamA family transporter [Xenophilus aerolatus]|nr:EamA family transporter [Xenophilus aerolatus]